MLDADTQRRAENFAIVCPLSDIEDADMLMFLATLIQDHDHLREKLLTEPDKAKRRQKNMASSLSWAELSLQAKTLE